MVATRNEESEMSEHSINELALKDWEVSVCLGLGSYIGIHL